MTELTLEAYERAEREVKMQEARTGIVWHGTVTVLVWAVIVPINILFASGFPWSLFAIGGMALGLFFHWIAYRHTDDDIRKQQTLVESRARTRA